MEGEIYGARTHTHTHSSNISAMHQLLQGAYLGMIHRLPAAASDLGVEAGAGRLRRLVLVAVAAASRDFFVCSRKKLSKKEKKQKRLRRKQELGELGSLNTAVEAALRWMAGVNADPRGGKLTSARGFSK